jgi:hypothetical protein
MSTSLASPLINLSEVTPEDFATRFAFVFNTWVSIGYCPECLPVTLWVAVSDLDISKLYQPIAANRTWANDLMYHVSWLWLGLFIACSAIMLIGGILAIVVESMTVAPDVLGYVSTVARNSKYLQLPKTSTAMSGGERANALGGVKVMMQDVKGNADIGRIALGLKHDDAKRLEKGRLYR